MPIVNFATETIKNLESYGYTVEDIDWIGTETFTVPINEFFDVARKTDYNNGYGRPEVPTDLIIMMKDQNWFDRWEYDGSEGWEHHNYLFTPRLISHICAKSFNYLDEDMSINDWAPTLFEYCVKKG